MLIRYREALCISVLYGTCILGSVASSDPKLHLESHQVKNLKGAQRPVASSDPKVHLESHQVQNLKGAHTSKHFIDASVHPMLQLMSMSLDNWGSMHSEARRGMLRNQSKPPLLSMMSLSLDTWGSHATGLPSSDILGTVIDYVVQGNPLAQVAPGESNLFDHRGFETHSMSFLLEANQESRLVNFGVIVAVLFLLALMICCLCWDGSVVEDDYDRPDSRNDLQQDFVTVEFTDGSWAQVYREARGEQKEALELLFRCNIISTDEFAFSSVSPEHIQECIWIATHMLRQKPLEEWVALWQQAQQTFEDSVAACFEARGGPYSASSLPSSFQESPGMAAPHSLPSLNFGATPHRLDSTICEDDDADDPYTTRSHYQPHGAQDLSPPGMPIPGSQNSAASVETRWSVESELDKGLAAQNSARAPG